MAVGARVLVGSAVPVARGAELDVAVGASVEAEVSGTLACGRGVCAAAVVDWAVCLTAVVAFGFEPPHAEITAAATRSNIAHLQPRIPDPL